MRQLVSFLLLCVVLCMILCNYARSSKTPINDCADALFGDRAKEPEFLESFHTTRDPTRSYVEDLCSLMRGPQRYGCCKGMSVKYLYNVMLEDGNIVLFEGRKFNRSVSAALRSFSHVPYVQSVLKRKTHNFDWPIEHRKSDFNRTKCKMFINGTLHVVGRLTTNNLYHAINDNLLPLVSQVVLDSYIDPEYNSLLRAQLVNFQKDNDKESVRHMLLQKHFIPYMVPIDSYQDRGINAGRAPPGTGLCVRRVVWGTGFKLMYQHLLSKLRRESVALMRYATVRNPPAVPEAYTKYLLRVAVQDTASSDTPAPMNLSLSSSLENVQLVTERPVYPPVNAVTTLDHNCKPLSAFTSSTKISAVEGLLIKPCERMTADGPVLYRPLNIVIYTRGDSGNGRTLKGESLFVEKFLQLKAFATICCNFRKTSLDEQLSYAVYADVVVGLHGAGLMNFLFTGSYSSAGAAPVLIELKTQYGDKLDLFTVAADSIQGVYVQIDLSTHVLQGGGGHRPVDDSLVKRVLRTLQLALKIQRKLYSDHLQSSYSYSSSSAVSGERCSSHYCTGKVVQPFEHYPLDIIVYPPHPQSNTNSSSSGSSSGSSDGKTVKAAEEQHHILGPLTSQVLPACRQLTTFTRYWQLIKADTSQYCSSVCPAPLAQEEKQVIKIDKSRMKVV